MYVCVHSRCQTAEWLIRRAGSQGLGHLTTKHLLLSPFPSNNKHKHRRSYALHAELAERFGRDTIGFREVDTIQVCVGWRETVETATRRTSAHA